MSFPESRTRNSPRGEERSRGVELKLSNGERGFFASLDVQKARMEEPKKVRSYIWLEWREG